MTSLFIGISHLKTAAIFLEDGIRESPNSIGASIAARYKKKTDWMLADFRTSPCFPAGMASKIGNEFSDDSALTMQSIFKKVMALSPEAREKLEVIIEKMMQE